MYTKYRGQEPKFAHFAVLVKKPAMPLDTGLAMPYRFGQAPGLPCGLGVGWQATHDRNFGKTE
jgi:hypothetical protein